MKVPLSTLIIIERKSVNCHLKFEIKKFKNLLYFEFNVIEFDIPDFSFINEILKAANPHTVISLFLCLSFGRIDSSYVQGSHVLQINHFHNLEELSITVGDYPLQKVLDDKILQSIAQTCSKLSNIQISGVDSITDVGFTYITDSLQIKSLRLTEVKISDTVISKMKSLEYLYCCSCQFIKNEGIMTLIETSQTIRTVGLYNCQSMYPEGLIDSIKKSPKYVLEIKVSKRIEGYLNSFQFYNFHKVGNQLRLKVKNNCDYLAYPKTCGSGCTICGEREDIYQIE